MVGKILERGRSSNCKSKPPEADGTEAIDVNRKVGLALDQPHS